MGNFGPSDRRLHDSSDDAGALTDSAGYRTVLLALLPLLAFVCAAFTATASWALLLLYYRGAYTEVDGYHLRLLVKAVFFSVVTVGGVWVLFRNAPRVSSVAIEANHDESVSKPARMVLFLALLLACALVFPRLGYYPWPAPDELHHLVVARNLAEHGAYASGHPDTAFKYFDSYDSVGAPVLLPVAGAFKVAGISLPVARLLIGFSYVALCGLAFLLLRRPFGAVPAACGALMLTASFGSVYLSRSVYGEVPAFMFLFGGLLLWGRSLRPGSAATMAVAAGVCFGLAVLTKAFLLVGAFAFVGVALFDRFTHRRIALRHVLWPAAGMAATLGLWWGVEFANRDLIAADGSTALLYRHNLLFGAQALLPKLGDILRRGPEIVLSLAVLGFVAPRVFRERYDPPSAVLFLLAVLFAFWWVFFTPGTIPRYLWYTTAVVALFTGVVIAQALRYLKLHYEPAPKSALAAGVVALAVTIATIHTVPQVRYIYFQDHVGAERELADYMETVPATARVATNYWPVQRTMNFMAGRYLDVLSESEAPASSYDVVIYSEYEPPIPREAIVKGIRMGHYVVFTQEQVKEAHNRD